MDDSVHAEREGSEESYASSTRALEHSGMPDVPMNRFIVRRGTALVQLG